MSNLIFIVMELVRKLSCVTICIIILFPNLLHSQVEGIPDTSFGVAGQVILQDTCIGEYFGSSTILPDGKLIVLMYGYVPGDVQDKLIFTRLLSDGKIDSTFGNDGQIISNLPFDIGNFGGVSKLLFSPDNKIILCGHLWTAMQQAAFVSKMNMDGTLDQEFGEGGTAIFDIGNGVDKFLTMSIKPDGKILLGGFTTANSNVSSLLVQIFPSGLPDTSFGVMGIVSYDFNQDNSELINDILCQSDGKIISVGSKKEITTDADDNAIHTRMTIIARFLPNGSIDTVFADNGVFSFGAFGRYTDTNKGVILSNHKMIFCGNTYQYSDNENQAILLRLTPDGELDTSFGTNGIVYSDFSFHENPSFITLQQDYKILISASGWTFTNGQAAVWLFRYNEDGTLDQSFGDHGKIVNLGVNLAPKLFDVLLQPNGKIIQVGSWPGNIILWRYHTNNLVGEKEPVVQQYKIKVYPNPLIKNDIYIDWELKSVNKVGCKIFNSQGDELQTLFEPELFSAGKHHKVVKLHKSIPSGNFYLQFTVGNAQTVLLLLKN